MLSFEISFVAAIGLAIGLIPHWFFAKLEFTFRLVATRTSLLIVLLPAASLILNACIALRNGIPQPHVQDEFSYLLAADTFSHFRLTNPTPKFPEHFETPHELMTPTYMSKYPPGQGLALALGKLLTGLPIVGVWITTAAACGCIYWVAMGFMPATSALLTGIVAVLHPELIHWSQNYWGGSVAVLGGALVLGGWSRLQNRLAVWDLFAFAAGLVVLANSRPYEGLLLAGPLVIQLLCSHRLNLRAFVCLSCMFIPPALWMGFYHYRITGHFLRMPFIAYSQQYDVYPKFWFLPRRAEPVFHNDSMRLIHAVFERGDYETLRTLVGLVKISAKRLWVLITAVGCPSILSVLVLFSMRDMRRRDWAGGTVAVFIAGIWAENFFLPHYAAPIVPLLIVLAVLGWKWVWNCGSAGRLISRSIAVGFIFGAVVNACAPIDRDSMRMGHQELLAQTSELWTGKHIIFVSYTADHLIHDEWVYNAADMEAADIVSAQDLGEAANAPVAAYFKDRTDWKLVVGKDSLLLNAYSPISVSKAREENRSNG